VERGILMKDLRSIVVLAAALLLPLDDACAERTVVLVTGKTCPISELSSLDVRKAYLGVAVRVDGHRLTPIQFIGDDLLSQIFFQSIVSMSRKSYERRALSLAIKYGTPRPLQAESSADVAEAIEEYQCGIVYLWKEDADRLAMVRTVRTLWQGE